MENLKTFVIIILIISNIYFIIDRNIYKSWSQYYLKQYDKYWALWMNYIK